MLLLGHRGARNYAPENTLAAFELALEHGCDGFEADVRLSVDAWPVICHDPELEGRDVANTAFEALAGCARALTHLTAVLQRFSDRCYLDIELKIAGAERAIVDLLRQYPPQRGFLVSSFFPEILRALYGLEPTLPLGFITKRAEHVEGWRLLPVQTLVAHEEVVTPELAATLHDAGRQLFVWTVNDRDAMLRFADQGADAIISDDTALLVSTLGGLR
jgi:glycerophosphoryl diester phosphodiesterase